MHPKPGQTGPVLAFDRGTLLLSGPGGKPAAGAAAGTWAWDERVSAWRCHAFQYQHVLREFSQRPGLTIRDEVPQPVRVPWPKVDLPALRAEQLEAISAWTKGGCRGQVIMPTGTGKTEVALAAMAQTQVATLVVAPIRDLMYQWHRRILKGLSYDAGIVGDNTFNLRPVTVTTYDSACIHMARIGGWFGLLVFDEEHHLPGPTYREAANRVLDEGVDVPEAKIAVVIGGQASTRQAKQRLGRILRKTGRAVATLYEVVCQTAGETERSRQRRRSDAYERTSHRRV